MKFVPLHNVGVETLGKALEILNFDKQFAELLFKFTFGMLHKILR